MNSLVRDRLVGVNAGGSGPYIGNLFARYDVSDMTDSGRVAGTPTHDARFGSFADISGNNRDLTASSGAIYKTNQFNGLPSLLFNRNSIETYKLATSYSITSHTIISVCDWVEAVQGLYSYVYFLSESNTVVGSGMARFRTTNTVYNYYRSSLYQSSESVSNGLKIVTMRVYPDVIEIYIDGYALTVPNPSSVLALTNINIILGGYIGGNNLFNGYLCENFIYDTNLINSNMNKTGNYLSDKWGASYTDIT